MLLPLLSLLFLVSAHPGKNQPERPATPIKNSIVLGL
jgi:hypothetical protein